MELFLKQGNSESLIYHVDHNNVRGFTESLFLGQFLSRKLESQGYDNYSWTMRDDNVCVCVER